MNAVLGKKGYWGYYMLLQLMLLYINELDVLSLDTASRNYHFINLRMKE